MNTGSILIIALICAGLGYVAGLIITKMNTNKSKVEIPPPLEQNATDHRPKFIANHLDVTLWSKTPEGLLLADVFGKTINSSRDLSETEQKKLHKDIQTIQAWIGSSLSIKEEPKSTITTVISEESATTTEEMPVVTTTNELLAAAEDVQPDLPHVFEPAVTVESLPKSDDEAIQTIFAPQPEPIKPVPAKLDLALKTRPAPPAPKSLVEQIDEILQEKVAKSAFSETGIKITANPQGGVEVWIGKQVFNGVDLVPDGSEKQLILQAIREWEKR